VKQIQVRDYSKNICLLCITNMVYEYPQYAVLITLYVIIQYLKAQYMRIITQIHVNMTPIAQVFVNPTTIRSRRPPPF
jgi:hypothetical protein